MQSDEAVGKFCPELQCSLRANELHQSTDASRHQALLEGEDGGGNTPQHLAEGDAQVSLELKIGLRPPTKKRD
jgi:hypothetical protein